MSLCRALLVLRNCANPEAAAVCGYVAGDAPRRLTRKVPVAKTNSRGSVRRGCVRLLTARAAACGWHESTWPGSAIGCAGVAKTRLVLRRRYVLIAAIACLPMLEQRKTLRDPAGRARVMLLRLSHVDHAERLGAPPQ